MGDFAFIFSKLYTENEMELNNYLLSFQKSLKT